MTSANTAAPASYGAAILRMALGAMYIAHSLVLKLLTFGLPGVAAFFAAHGLPGWLAYATFAAELIGGVLLILGVHTRLTVLALAPALVGAIVFVHLPNGWVFTAVGGGWEYPAFLLVASLAQALLGDGAFALRPGTGFAPPSMSRQSGFARGLVRFR